MQEFVDPQSLKHITVLLHEAVDALDIKEDGIYVDGTFGRGGHSKLILSKLSQKGRLIVFDKDPMAIKSATTLAKEDNRVIVVHSPFVYMKNELNRLGIEKVHGILLDLGISSPQIDDPSRGFSFRFDAPLDMRMDTENGESVAIWLEHAPEDEIKRVIRDYSEEHFAHQIARAIVEKRKTDPIVRTGDLASLVARVVKTREKGQHPATRTFQAFRIHINGELDELKNVLPDTMELLKEEGRLVIISFHSLEDRIVKTFMNDYSQEEKLPSWVMIKDEDVLPPPLQVIAKKVKPSEKEVEINPRSRSAIMRVAQRTLGPIQLKQDKSSKKGSSSRGR